MIRRLRQALLLAVLVCAPAAAQIWIAQAPGPTTGGQVENIDEGEVAGAVKAIALHPTNAAIAYIAAVNGGVWRTMNATDKRPHWKALTDRQSSLSMGAIEFDPTVGDNQTLVAGFGWHSSLDQPGGALDGLLRTTDGGDTWVPLRGMLAGINVSGLAPRGATIVVAADKRHGEPKAGVWRTTDTGGTWTHLSGSVLPKGSAWDLAGDRSNVQRLFTTAGDGLYRSLDTGATWKRVGTATMHTHIGNADNVRISVTQDHVYVVVSRNRQPVDVYHSVDGGKEWKSLGLPSTIEGGLHSGRQSNRHLSIAADRTNPAIFYLGGDAQFEGPGRFPDTENSIGARDYSGRLFRGDSLQSANKRWAHLTHSRTAAVPTGGTKSNSAPHADSRDLEIDANGDLIEADDGGLYRRNSPQSNGGDWISMNGDLQVTELHSIAWDSLLHVAVAGAQDTGTPAQRLAADVRWRSVDTGDGGCVAIDNRSSPTKSRRFSSASHLDPFVWETYTANNQQEYRLRTKAFVTPDTVEAPKFHFITPLRLNTVDPERLVAGAANGVYESFDSGHNAIRIDSARVNERGAQVLAYGAGSNPEVLYVGSGNKVLVRSAANAPLTSASSYPGGEVCGVAIDRIDGKTAFVLDPTRVFRTTNRGANWSEVTGNLQQLAPGELRSLTLTDAAGGDLLVVGSDAGIFASRGPAFTTWNRFDSDLPRVPVYQVEYDPVDRILVAATLGRGAWTLQLPPPPAPVDAGPVLAVLPSVPSVRPPTPVSPQTTSPQPPPSTNGVLLWPGVVIDPVERRAIVMNPDRGLDALSLVDASVIWRNAEAAKPLGIVNRRIIAQAEAPDAGTAETNRLIVLVLDAATGQELARSSTMLSVPVSLNDRSSGSFVVAARGAGQEASIVWEFVSRPSRERMVQLPTDQPGGGRGGRIQGQIRVNLNDGRMTQADGPSPIVPLAWRQPMTLPIAESPVATPEPLFLSADGRHFIVSERIRDSDALERYDLTVYERGTRNRIGHFRNAVSVLPFFVADSIAFVVTEPFTRLINGRGTEVPLMIRAINLQTQEEVWSRPVRDTAYRGPKHPSPAPSNQ